MADLPSWLVALVSCTATGLVALGAWRAREARRDRDVELLKAATGDLPVLREKLRVLEGSRFKHSEQLRGLEKDTARLQGERGEEEEETHS